MTTTLITGANRGIGLELARQLRARGHDVIAICRKGSPELAATGARVEEGIDVASDAAPAEIAKRVAGAKIDLLIHNAGILRGNALGALDLPSLRDQMETNAIAPLRITDALVDALGRGSKIAIVTSLMGSIADNGSGGFYGYRMSKAALNIAGESLARDLRSRGVAVVLLHPGYVRTGMTANNGNVEPADAARGLLARIDALTLETSGKFFHADGRELPW
jgi:NAD(P)-dependent dehydrogenase (short-subunit alcohol dehydrogenase family)